MWTFCEYHGLRIRGYEASSDETVDRFVCVRGM
jgi:hypothetical protein